MSAYVLDCAASRPTFTELTDVISRAYSLNICGLADGSVSRK
jgi:hypothetical protein